MKCWKCWRASDRTQKLFVFSRLWRQWTFRPLKRLKQPERTERKINYKIMHCSYPWRDGMRAPLQSTSSLLTPAHKNIHLLIIPFPFIFVLLCTIPCRYHHAKVRWSHAQLSARPGWWSQKAHSEIPVLRFAVGCEAEQCWGISAENQPKTSCDSSHREERHAQSSHGQFKVWE